MSLENSQPQDPNTSSEPEVLAPSGSIDSSNLQQASLSQPTVPGSTQPIILQHPTKEKVILLCLALLLCIGVGVVAYLMTKPKESQQATNTEQGSQAPTDLFGELGGYVA